jgi:hypothetical protein
VVDTGGNEIVADVDYLDVNTLNVTFGAATSGKAVCN